jgi:hypothetical protein
VLEPLLELLLGAILAGGEGGTGAVVLDVDGAELALLFGLGATELGLLFWGVLLGLLVPIEIEGVITMLLGVILGAAIGLLLVARRTVGVVLRVALGLGLSIGLGRSLGLMLTPLQLSIWLLNTQPLLPSCRSIWTKGSCLLTSSNFSPLGILAAIAAVRSGCALILVILSLVVGAAKRHRSLAIRRSKELKTFKLLGITLGSSR